MGSLLGERMPADLAVLQPFRELEMESKPFTAKLVLERIGSCAKKLATCETVVMLLLRETASGYALD